MDGREHGSFKHPALRLAVLIVLAACTVGSSLHGQALAEAKAAEAAAKAAERTSRLGAVALLVSMLVGAAYLYFRVEWDDVDVEPDRDGTDHNGASRQRRRPSARWRRRDSTTGRLLRKNTAYPEADGA